MLDTGPAGPTERAEDVTSLVPAGVHPRPARNYRFAEAGRNHRGANTGLGDPLGIAIKAAPGGPGRGLGRGLVDYQPAGSYQYHGHGYQRPRSGGGFLQRG